MTDAPPRGEPEPRAPMRRWLDDDRWQRRWGAISAIATAISLVFVVIAAGIAGFEYYRASKQEQVERVMKFVESWDGPEMRAAREVVRQRVDALNSSFASVIPGEQMEKERAAYRLNIGEKAIAGWRTGKPIEAEVDRLFDFLNGVGFCVAHDLCEREVATAYFSPFATSMFSYFSVYVDQRRNSEPNYATYAERMKS